MKAYQKQFLKFAIENEVLKFGEFTLKSGRVSPYFFNAGEFNNGRSMNQIARFFAASIQDSDIQFDVLFGPAYKGITLACASAMALADETDEKVPYAYNRKEKKDHGEGGSTVGSALSGKVAIIDDVITAGTSIRESVEIIRNAGAQPAAVFIALDREERSPDQDHSSVQAINREYGIPVVAIARLSDLLEYLRELPGFEQHRSAVQAYRDQYGVE